MLRKMCRVMTLGLCLSATSAFAQDVGITEDIVAREITINGQTYVFERNQDPAHVIEPEFAKTSRACPPFCLHPMSAADGVDTIGELELMDFLEEKVATGEGLMIDSRVPEWFSKGSIPAAINVPFSTLEATNPYRDQIVEALGATRNATGFDFSNVMELVVFGNGPWDDQGARGIRDLIEAGYPADKIHYYRGGMQMWLQLGLTVERAPA